MLIFIDVIPILGRVPRAVASAGRARDDQGLRQHLLRVAVGAVADAQVVCADAGGGGAKQVRGL